MSPERARRKYQKQNAKRRGDPRLPSSYITAEEYVLLHRLGELYGSKRAAIVMGLRLLALADNITIGKK